MGLFRFIFVLTSYIIAENIIFCEILDELPADSILANSPFDGQQPGAFPNGQTDAAQQFSSNLMPGPVILNDNMAKQFEGSDVPGAQVAPFNEQGEKGVPQEGGEHVVNSETTNFGDTTFPKVPQPFATETHHMMQQPQVVTQGGLQLPQQNNFESQPNPQVPEQNYDSNTVNNLQSQYQAHEPYGQQQQQNVAENVYPNQQPQLQNQPFQPLQLQPAEAPAANSNLYNTYNQQPQSAQFQYPQQNASANNVNVQPPVYPAQAPGQSLAENTNINNVNYQQQQLQNQYPGQNPQLQIQNRYPEQNVYGQQSQYQPQSLGQNLDRNAYLNNVNQQPPIQTQGVVQQGYPNTNFNNAPQSQFTNQGISNVALLPQQPTQQQEQQQPHPEQEQRQQPEIGQQQQELPKTELEQPQPAQEQPRPALEQHQPALEQPQPAIEQHQPALEQPQPAIEQHQTAQEQHVQQQPESSVNQAPTLSQTAHDLNDNNAIPESKQPAPIVPASNIDSQSVVIEKTDNAGAPGSIYGQDNQYRDAGQVYNQIPVQGISDQGGVGNINTQFTQGAAEAKVEITTPAEEMTELGWDNPDKDGADDNLAVTQAVDYDHKGNKIDHAEEFDNGDYSDDDDEDDNVFGDFDDDVGDNDNNFDEWGNWMGDVDEKGKTTTEYAGVSSSTEEISTEPFASIFEDSDESYARKVVSSNTGFDSQMYGTEPTISVYSWILFFLLLFLTLSFFAYWSRHRIFAYIRHRRGSRNHNNHYRKEESKSLLKHEVA